MVYKSLIDRLLSRLQESEHSITIHHPKKVVIKQKKHKDDDKSSPYEDEIELPKAEDEGISNEDEILSPEEDLPYEDEIPPDETLPGEPAAKAPHSKDPAAAPYEDESNPAGSTAPITISAEDPNAPPPSEDPTGVVPPPMLSPNAPYYEDQPPMGNPPVAAMPPGAPPVDPAAMGAGPMPPAAPSAPATPGSVAPYEDELGQPSIEDGETIGNAADETASPPIPKEDLARIEHLKNIHAKLLDVKNVLNNETESKYDNIKNKLRDGLKYFGHIVENLDSYVEEIDDLIVKYKRFTFVLVKEIEKAKASKKKPDEKSTPKKDKVDMTSNNADDSPKNDSKPKIDPTVSTKKSKKDLINKTKIKKDS